MAKQVEVEERFEGLQNSQAQSTLDLREAFIAVCIPGRKVDRLYGNVSRLLACQQ